MRILSGAICVLSLVLGSVAWSSPADREFAALSADFIDHLPDFSPVGATSLGDHRFDDCLDQVDAAARSRNLARYKKYRSSLDKIDWQALSRANKIDAELLRNEFDSHIWSLTVLQEWAWNPLVYVNLSGTALYSLMSRDFAPIGDRLDDAASRLEQFPRFLKQARAALQPARVPKIHAQTAIEQNRGISSIIDTMIVPELDDLPDDAAARLKKAIATARDALAVHQTWLETRLLPQAAGDFRLGEELFDAKLRYTLNSSLSRREIRMRAESEYTAVRDEMFQIAKGIYAKLHPYATFPDDPDEAFKQVITRAALQQANQHTAEPDAIVDTARQYLSQATAFVREKNLATVPDAPVEVIIMPEYQRGVAVAYLDPAGPLDKGQASFYAVAPLPDDWTGGQIDSFLREYNLYAIQNLTLHEAMPGHYLQLALSNRYPSALRGVLWSGPFVEGWAVYGARVMIDEGYLNHDPLMRLINLKWYLRCVTNAILDQAIHVDGMSREEAMRLMIEGAFQEEREAAGKWVRAQLTSTQLSTYFIGFQEHMDLRHDVERAWGDDFTLRKYHDELLSHGSPPVKYVRALMLDEEIPHNPD